MSNKAKYAALTATTVAPQEIDTTPLADILAKLAALYLQSREGGQTIKTEQDAENALVLARDVALGMQTELTADTLTVPGMLRLLGMHESRLVAEGYQLLRIPKHVLESKGIAFPTMNVTVKAAMLWLKKNAPAIAKENAATRATKRQAEEIAEREASVIAHIEKRIADLHVERETLRMANVFAFGPMSTERPDSIDQLTKLLYDPTFLTLCAAFKKVAESQKIDTQYIATNVCTLITAERIQDTDDLRARITEKGSRLWQYRGSYTEMFCKWFSGLEIQELRDLFIEAIDARIAEAERRLAERSAPALSEEQKAAARLSSLKTQRATVAASSDLNASPEISRHIILAYDAYGHASEHDTEFTTINHIVNNMSGGFGIPESTVLGVRAKAQEIVDRPDFFRRDMMLQRIYRWLARPELLDDTKAHLLAELDKKIATAQMGTTPTVAPAIPPVRAAPIVLDEATSTAIANLYLRAHPACPATELPQFVSALKYLPGPKTIPAAQDEAYPAAFTNAQNRRLKKSLQAFYWWFAGQVDLPEQAAAARSVKEPRPLADKGKLLDLGWTNTARDNLSYAFQAEIMRDDKPLGLEPTDYRLNETDIRHFVHDLAVGIGSVTEFRDKMQTFKRYKRAQQNEVMLKGLTDWVTSYNYQEIIQLARVGVAALRPAPAKPVPAAAASPASAQLTPEPAPSHPLAQPTLRANPPLYPYA